MKKFTIDPIRFMELHPSFPFPTDEQVREAIFANNEEFKSYKDSATGFPVIECKNRPRNLEIYNIFWRELDE